MADLLSAATPTRLPAEPEADQAGSGHGVAVGEGAPVSGVSTEAAAPLSAAMPAQPAAPLACLLAIEVLLSGDGRSLVFSPSQEAVQVLAAFRIVSLLGHHSPRGYRSSMSHSMRVT